MNSKLFGEIKETQDKRLEEKMLRYQNRRERQLKEREEAEGNKKANQKVHMHDFLMKQMAEKEARERDEKADNYEQAEIWKKEKEEFDAFESKKEEKTRKAYSQFSTQLKKQIESNKSKTN